MHSFNEARYFRGGCIIVVLSIIGTGKALETVDNSFTILELRMYVVHIGCSVICAMIDRTQTSIETIEQVLCSPAYSYNYVHASIPLKATEHESPPLPPKVLAHPPPLPLKVVGHLPSPPP